MIDAATAIGESVWTIAEGSIGPAVDALGSGAVTAGETFINGGSESLPVVGA